jgi:solute carrier family 35 protein
LHQFIKKYLYNFFSGYGDLSFNLVAYACGIGSNFTQAIYLLLVQRFSQHHKLSTTETLQLNCFNTLPILLLTAFANGEIEKVGSYPMTEHPYFIIAFLLTVSVGMLLNYSLFLCTGLTSALTTSVVGGLKAMVQTVLGLVTFGGVSNNLPTYLGISLNLAGGLGYIAVKYTENNSKLQLRSLQKVMSFSSLVKRVSAAPSIKHSNGELNGFITHDKKGHMEQHPS